MTTLRRAVARIRESTGDFYNQLRADFAPMSMLEVNSFSTPDDISRFQVTTDRVLGGKTDCSFSLRQYAHFAASRFEGVIDYHDDNPNTKGGFAAFRTKPDERERDLLPFQALEMRIKTDGRKYIANFKSGSHSPEHLWQMAIMSEPYTWVTVAVPFSQLVLTRRGRVDIAQSPLNRERFNGFGILLADGHNGPFKFEIQWLRAIRDFHPSMYEPVPAYQLEETATQQAAIAERTMAEQARAAIPAGQEKADEGRQKLLEFYRKQKEAAKA